MIGVEETKSSRRVPSGDDGQTFGAWFSKFSGHLFVAAVAVICLFSPSVPFWTGVAFVLVAYVLADFVRNCSNGIQLVDATLLIAGVQWFIIAHFVYLSPNASDSIHTMQLDESTYMFNTLIAYVGYWAGMKLFAPKVIWREYESRTSEMFWDIALAIGVVLFAANFVFPSFVTQLGVWIIIGYLLKNICYTPPKTMYIWALVAVDVYVFIQSIISSMFHQLLLMLLMQMLFIAVIRKIPGKKLCLIIFVGLMLINVLQISKNEYRAVMDNYSVVDRLEAFHKLFWDNMQDMFSPDDDLEEYPLGRYNQGWLISHVYTFMDGRFHSENLSKFKDSLLAIALPRFLMPGKRQAGGKDNINDFTDLTLTENTSMNISTVGEGYAYFGRYGNFIFHFLIGGIFAGVLHLLMHWERVYGVGVFCIPAIFSLSIRAESDFVTGYNALFKTLLLFALLLWYSNSRVQKKGLLDVDDGYFDNDPGGVLK